MEPSDSADASGRDGNTGEPGPSAGFFPCAETEHGVYAELRALAGAYLAGQRPGHTLQPTALVHEACVRLMDRGDLRTGDPRAFVAAAARAMRTALVDHARSRARQKRGGGLTRLPLDDVVDSYEQRALDLSALDTALARLGELDAAAAVMVELRFFGGLTEQETADILGVSARTVGRTWRRARAWLRRELRSDTGHDERSLE